jgi:hypothetical protein
MKKKLPNQVLYWHKKLSLLDAPRDSSVERPPAKKSATTRGFSTAECFRRDLKCYQNHEISAELGGKTTFSRGSRRC